ncbi:sensor histidine kinase [Saccharothrix coeruleofusca]|uniref:sensor histidine kinase n=1 Tax=Saccharothrix coeruleofusca TaxID=33919 RepID=UPI00167121D9|nr:histidine kinase [Saccharothrix coeruleofusca]
MSAQEARELRGRLARRSWLAAVICLVADVGEFLLSGPQFALSPREWAVLVLVAAVDACLAAPPRFSGGVAALHAVVLIAAPLLLADDSTRELSGTGVLIAGYLAGAWLPLTPALGTLVVLGTAVAANALLAPDGAHGRAALVFTVLGNGVLPWVVGRHTTTRRGQLAALERLAERREHDERMAVAQAVAEERSAIARDLHDVISHHVSAIAVHAGAARIAAPDAEDSAVGRALHAVEIGSRAAMVDLRRLLDVLHGREDAAAQRQPGLDNLEELLAGVRRAGLAVTFTATGTGPTALPDSLDLALYRIAQEALTNALRHGGPGPVTVRLDRGDDAITLTVTNPLPTAPARPRSSSPGRGLDGIRQRVALFEGDVEIGPVAGGAHWRVRARFAKETMC